MEAEVIPSKVLHISEAVWNVPEVLGIGSKRGSYRSALRVTRLE
jgi:hypothetical protein